MHGYPIANKKDFEYLLTADPIAYLIDNPVNTPAGEDLIIYWETLRDLNRKSHEQHTQIKVERMKRVVMHRETS